MDGKIRVQKIICNNSDISRRKAEKLIDDGKVKVNGVIVSLGASADPFKDEILVNNKRIVLVEKKYLALNKPVGCVTSTFDPHEKTVMKYIPKKFGSFNLFPVGRLDKDSEGLLLLSNDGDFANKVMHPSNNVKKTYRGVVSGVLSKKDISSLRSGVVLEEGVAKCKIKFEVLKGETLFEVTIDTGWNRQIRRMFEVLGFEVVKLKRVRIGKLDLKDLEGKLYKEYSKSEIEEKIGLK